MDDIKKRIQDTLPKGLILDEAVLEKIVGGISTGMTKEDLDSLLSGAGLGNELTSDFIGYSQAEAGRAGEPVQKMIQQS